MHSNGLLFRRLALGPLLFFFVFVFVMGCNTPSSRIAKNPELFNSLPLSAQERIRAGEVDVGFSVDLVIMALGPPSRSYIRTTRNGQSEVWAYTDYKVEFEQQLVDATFQYKDHKGITRTGRDKVWAQVKSRVEYDVMRVELVNNHVVAFEKTP